MSSPTISEIVPFRRCARPTISLEDAKRTVFGITSEVISSPDGFVTSVVNRHILAGNGGKMSILAQVRLHALCIVGNIQSLNNFIREFSHSNGLFATELLLNSQLPAGNGVPNCSSFYITPMMTAIFWNKDKDIIRLLYSYGGSVGVGLDSAFPEEKILAIPYFDHLSGGWGPYPQPMWRQSSDFTQVIQEVRSLAGEPGIEQGWIHPYTPVP